MLMLRAVGVCLALWVLSFSAVAFAQNDPRYLAAVRSELIAMGLAPQCAALNGETGSCRVRTTVAAAGAMPGGAPTSGREFTVTLEYSDASDTIYVYADRYATLQSNSAQAPAALRRMLEMNWEMLVGKFEWSSATGELRLSAVMHTDSNFDRRAFRGVVRTIVRLAERYAPEMSQLTGSPVGSPVNPPGGNAPTAREQRAPNSLPAAPQQPHRPPASASLTPLGH